MAVVVAFGLVVRRGDFAGFKELLGVAEVFLDLHGGIFAEELGVKGAEDAGGGIVGEEDFHFGAAASGRFGKEDLAGIGDLGILGRLPGDFFVGFFGDAGCAGPWLSSGSVFHPAPGRIRGGP
jgi:hypothetical protein